LSDLLHGRKIVCPALPPAILHREALVQRLSEAIVGRMPGSEGILSYKLVLLHAPAGYGKTTLLVDFARQSNLSCCWYALDRSDIDIITFLEYLLASIRTRFPLFGASLDSLLVEAKVGDVDQRQAKYRLEKVVEALLEALITEIRERFALVLCNYHEVNASQEINSLINQLLRRPSSCVLVLESRAIPDLEFATLLARREMIAINSDLFRLSSQEIQQLAIVQGVAPLSDMEAEQLARAFDGWMAGVLLGTRLGDVRFLSRKRDSSVPLLRGLSERSIDQQFLFAYVVNEVFTQHPDEYAFLKDASVLQEMSPAMCAALLDISPSEAQDHLQYLEQYGLFVTHSGSDPQITYTCHPVLRELFTDDLHRQAPERFTMRHQRAAELLYAEHDYEHAIYHAHKAGADDMMAHFIIEIAEEIFIQKYMETLPQWIDMLPCMILERYPQLLLIRAKIFLKRGEYSQAFPLLDTASTVYTNTQAIIDQNDLLAMQTEIMILRSKALFQAGKYQESQTLCEQLLDITPIDAVTIRAEAHFRFGICANLLGDLTSGVEHLQKALQLWGRHTVSLQTADTHSALASTYSLMGNFVLVEHHLLYAISYNDQLHDVRGKVNNLIRMSTYKQRQGAFAEAESVSLQALEVARNSGFVREEAYILEELGEIYQDQGYYDQSLKSLDKSIALGRQVGDNYLVNYSVCSLAITYLLINDASTAMLLLSEMKLPSHDGNKISYERAAHDVTYATILLHQKLYDDAYACFTSLDTVLKITSFKRELLQVKLGMAACRLASAEQEDVVHNLEEITSLLANSSAYEQFVRIALHRLPALEQIVKALPEMARLRTMLHLDTEVQETMVSTQPLPPILAPKITIVHQPLVRILAFGEPTVLLDEKPITRWRMARTLELFFFLLDSGRPMSKEQIITALWPEVDEHVDQTLHSIIYYLRKALGESCIISRKGTYNLNLASLYGEQIWYDVTAFQDEHVNARKALAQQDDATARTALQTMVELYRGDYVQSFYSDWCAFRRDALRTAYLDAHRHLAQIAWRAGEIDESATYWQQLLAVDMGQEDAHYGLMRCYLRQGKRSLALRQYQRCRESLLQELGVEPGPNIQQFYQHLVESPRR
jgi:LuxR family transcriptional regulator, maltose regulon positive regulatory protein